MKKSLLISSMTKSTFAPVCFIKGLGGNPRHCFVFGDYHLADSFSILNFLYLITEVHNDDAYFATIIRVYRPRGIEHG